jgi:hypothetical protein
MSLSENNISQSIKEYCKLLSLPVVAQCYETEAEKCCQSKNFLSRISV